MKEEEEEDEDGVIGSKRRLFADFLLQHFFPVPRHLTERQFAECVKLQWKFSCRSTPTWQSRLSDGRVPQREHSRFLPNRPGFESSDHG